MGYLLAGLGLFTGIHLVFPALQPLRASMKNRLGDNGYKGLFSILALAGIVLMVVGYRQAEFSHVYTPPTWGRTLTGILMAFSLILFAAANMPGNIKRFTRHPMLWGLVLWSMGHLAVKGDVAAIILFGGLGAFALLAMMSANIRGAKKQSHTLPLRKDMMIIVAGLVVYVGIRFIHPNI